MLIKKNNILILLLMFSHALLAQDPHFSQYQSSPLTLNPAMTGVMPEDYRFAMNYRTQYWAIGNSFTTATVSLEEKIPTEELQEAVNKLAWGLNALYDVSAGGGYKNISMAVSGSYSKPLDFEGSTHVSIGCQGVLTSRQLSNNNFSFSNQFDGDNFNMALPNNENLLSYRKTFATFNVGLLYSKNSTTNRFYVGAAMYHVNRPNISFDRDKSYKLPSRYVIHTGYRTSVGQNLNYLLLNVNYMSQASAKNIMAGGAFGWVLQKDDEQQAAVTTGIWYRYQDALIPYVGLDWNKYQLGMTYDMLHSGLKTNSPKTGAFEISLRYGGYRKQIAFVKDVIGREY